MAQDRVGAFIELEVVEDGDTIGGTLLAIGSLEQQRDKDTGAFTPDYTVAADQPIVYPNFTSALKGGVITGMDNFREVNIWFAGQKIVNNGVLTSGDDGWWLYTTQNNCPAIKRLKNMGAGAAADDGVFELRFECEVYNGANWIKKVVSTNMTLTTVSKSGYNIRLSADNGGIVDANTSPVTKCILTPDVRLGGEKITSGLFFKYFKMVDGKWVAFGSNTTSRASVTVTADDVDGEDAFMVEVYKGSATGNKLGSDVQSVIDNSDPFRVEMAQDRFSYGSPVQNLAPKIMQGANDVTSGFTFTSLQLIDNDGTVLKSAAAGSKTISVSFDDVKGKIRPGISLNATRG